MRNFINYIISILKQTILIICFLLDIIGIVIFYYKNFTIPQYFYYILPLIGFFYANYHIYKENLPEINISLSKINNYPLKLNHCADDFIDFRICYNLYINNSGNNAGIIENIELKLSSFCKIKEEFILNKIEIKFDNFYILEKSNYFKPISSRDKVKFPIILKPKETITKSLVLELTIAGKDRNDYINTLKWINNIEFYLYADTKNNNISSKKKYTIIVDKKEIDTFRIESEANVEIVDAVFEETNNNN